MSTFLEHASPARDANLYPTLAQPLPRLTPLPAPDPSGPEKFEVVVVGVNNPFSNTPLISLLKDLNFSGWPGWAPSQPSPGPSGPLRLITPLHRRPP
jgi:hypothetical protein